MRLKKFNEEFDFEHYNKYSFITEMEKINVDIDDKQLEIKNLDWVDITTCKVYWEYKLDLNKGGIDGIIPSVVKITLSLDVSTYDKEKDDMGDNVEKEFEFDLYNTEFEEEYRDLDGNQILPFYPRGVEFIKISGKKDDKAKIKVSFNE